MSSFLSNPDLASWAHDVAVEPARPALSPSGVSPMARLAGAMLVLHALLNTIAAWASLHVPGANVGALPFQLVALAVDVVLGATLLVGSEGGRVVTLVRVILGSAVLVLAYTFQGNGIEAGLHALGAIGLVALMTGRASESRVAVGIGSFAMVLGVEVLGIAALLSR